MLKAAGLYVQKAPKTKAVKVVVPPPGGLQSCATPVPCMSISMFWPIAGHAEGGVWRAAMAFDGNAFAICAKSKTGGIFVEPNTLARKKQTKPNGTRATPPSFPATLPLDVGPAVTGPAQQVRHTNKKTEQSRVLGPAFVASSLRPPFCPLGLSKNQVERCPLQSWIMLVMATPSQA